MIEDMFIGMISITPEEVLIEALEVKLTNYKIRQDQESKEDFYRACSLLSIKETIDRKNKEDGGLEKFSEDLNQIKSIRNMFDKKMS